MDPTSPAGDGLRPTVRRMFKTLRDMAENRIELFLIEWQEERLRLVDALLLLMVGTVCALMALLVVTFAIVAVFWNTHRVLVLALIIIAYAGAAATALVTLHFHLRRWRAFAATLEQIKKDQACFKEKS